MGMQVGESKGGTMAEMNVVPLIDILLVLLIIFMVITPLTPKGLDTLVPQPNPNQIFKERAEKVAFVKGDNEVLFEEVARAIDIMRAAGIDKVGLITAKLEAGQ